MNHEAGKHAFEPPSTAAELDALLARIEAGSETFASLSDEQRHALEEELCETWLEEWLDDHPVPADREEAEKEYRLIASGKRYPFLLDNVRNDLLLHFDDRYGEGGPDHWPRPSRHEETGLRRR